MELNYLDRSGQSQIEKLNSSNFRWFQLGRMDLAVPHVLRPTASEEQIKHNLSQDWEDHPQMDPFKQMTISRMKKACFFSSGEP